MSHPTPQMQIWNFANADGQKLAICYLYAVCALVLLDWALETPKSSKKTIERQHQKIPSRNNIERTTPKEYRNSLKVRNTNLVRSGNWRLCDCIQRSPKQSSTKAANCNFLQSSDLANLLATTKVSQKSSTSTRQKGQLHLVSCL